MWFCLKRAARFSVFRRAFSQLATRPTLVAEAPLISSHEIPFKVKRNKLNMLPVYVVRKCGKFWTEETVLNNTSGDLSRLRLVLEEELGGIEVRYVSKQIRIRGNFREDIESFLLNLGF